MTRPDFSNLSTKKPRDTDVATSQLGQHTEVEPTTAEGPAMAHPRTDVPPAAPPPQTKPLPTWLKWFVVAAVIVTALGFWLMFSNRHTDPTPAPPPAPTTLTPQQKAEADTQKVYGLWLQSFSAALTANFDTTKLDGGLVTSEVLKGAQNFIDGGRNYMAPKGISATLTYNTVKVRTVDFTPNQVTSEICAVRNLRLVQNGKDITTDENGAVHPPNIAATDQKVVYTNSDGKWQISSFEFNADAGSPC